MAQLDLVQVLFNLWEEDYYQEQIFTLEEQVYASTNMREVGIPCDCLSDLENILMKDAFRAGFRAAAGAVKDIYSQSLDFFGEILEKTSVGKDDIKEKEFDEMTKEEKIANFVGSVLSQSQDSFKKDFLSMLVTFDESDWVFVQKVFQKRKA